MLKIMFKLFGVLNYNFLSYNNLKYENWDCHILLW